MERIGPVAQGQHGVIERGQAIDQGIPPSTLTEVSARRLERVHPGVYRVAGAPRTWEQQVMAAVLAAGEGAVASHRSAARLWGLHEDGTVEVTVPYPRQSRLRGVVVHRSRDLAPEWVSQAAGGAGHQPADDLVDLGVVLPAREVEMPSTGPWWPVAAGRRPPPGRLQHEVRAGRRRIRVDFAYPHLHLAIEVDGLETHGTARALQADLDRQNALVALGWTVVRFTWADVVRRPEKVAETVRRLLPPSAVA